MQPHSDEAKTRLCWGKYLDFDWGKLPLKWDAQNYDRTSASES